MLKFIGIWCLWQFDASYSKAFRVAEIFEYCVHEALIPGIMC